MLNKQKKKKKQNEFTNKLTMHCTNAQIYFEYIV